VLFRSIANGPSGTFTFLPITTDNNGNFSNVINTTTSSEITTFNNNQVAQTYAIVISTTQPVGTFFTTGPNGNANGPLVGSVPNILVQANVTVTGGPSARVVANGS